MVKTKAYRILFIGIAVLLFPNLCFSADQTASSCSASDIQAAINACANGGGGTVTLPACDKDSGTPNGAKWNAGDKICIASVDAIRVLGQGEAITDIGYVAGASPGSANVSCPAGHSSISENFPIIVQGVGVKELGQFSMSLSTTGTGGGIYVRQCMGADAVERRSCTNAANNVRFHHITLNNMSANARGIYFCQNWRGVTLFDHIRMYNPNPSGVPGIYGISVNGGWAEEAFEVNPSFGTNNGLFVEDSTFDGLYHSIAAFYAARLTARHNTFRNVTSGIEGHGAGFVSGCGYGDPIERNGSYRYEIYDNRWESGSSPIYFRSGFFIITDNYFDTNMTSSDMISSYPEPGNVYPARINCTVAKGCPWAYRGYTTSEDCFQTPRAWIWNNDFQGNNPNGIAETTCGRLGYEYLRRAPQSGDPYFTGSNYIKYTYPHPLNSGGPPPLLQPMPPNIDNNITGWNSYFAEGKIYGALQMFPDYR